MKLAFVLIFELGIKFAMLVMISALVIEIISLALSCLRALRTDRLGDFYFALFGALFLASVLLILIGAIVIELT